MLVLRILSVIFLAIVASGSSDSADPATTKSQIESSDASQAKLEYLQLKEFEHLQLQRDKLEQRLGELMHAQENALQDVLENQVGVEKQLQRLKATLKQIPEGTNKASNKVQIQTEIDKHQGYLDELTLKRKMVQKEFEKQIAEQQILIAQKVQAIDDALKAMDPAFAKKVAPKPNAMTPVADTPGLPRVLLIGDSISIGYTLPVRELLAGKANVHRVLMNCGPTTYVNVLDGWLNDKRHGEGKWDVIHFNFGLHDIKFADENGKLIEVTSTGKQQVSLANYEKNLREIVGKLKATGAKLIFCTTTPVPEGAAGRIPGDEVRYNEVALRVMKENDIAVDDLYAFAKPRIEKIQNKKDVHFSAAGSKELAGQVVSTIEAALKK